MFTVSYHAAMRLRDLYPTMTTEERVALAKSVDVLPGYLWQIATGWQDNKGRTKRASLDLVAKLARADARLHVQDMVAEFEAVATTEQAA